MDYPAASLSELVSFLDSQDEPSIVMDADYCILAANRAYTAAFGRMGAVTGRHCYEVSHRFAAPCDQAGEPCPLNMSRQSGQAQRVLHLHHTPTGEEHVDVQTTPIRDRHGRLAYFVESMHVVRQASSRPAAEGLVGRSPRFQSMLALALRVAPTSANVLLRGETGTGKELLARLIHEAGRAARGPFVVVDCSGLSETLFESELFGYEKGAFTGAQHRKTGLVEAANGGTLFLDEVGDIPGSLQVKLLRLLENGTFRRVGGVEVLRSTFRFAEGNLLFYKLQFSMRSAPARGEAYDIIKPWIKSQHEPVLALFSAAEKDNGNMRGRAQAYTITLLGMANAYIQQAVEENIALNDELAYQARQQFMYGIFS